VSKFQKNGSFSNMLIVAISLYIYPLAMTRIQKKPETLTLAVPKEVDNDSDS
jgi:hypothetical protein